MKPVGELYQESREKPYDKAVHDHLIRILRMDKINGYKQLYDARMNKFQYFMITEDEIADTLEDLMCITDEAARNNIMDQFYCWLISELPTVDYWIQYIEFCGKTKPSNEVQEILIKALGDTVHDFEGSKVIWDKTIEFALEMYGETQEEEELIRVWKLMLKRLSYPHKTLQESFESTSSFVSKFCGDEYTQWMKTASQVYSKASNEQRYFEAHEMNLSRNPGDIESWKAYISDVTPYASDLTQVKTVFYRSLMYSGPEWISVWIKYIYCLYSKSENQEFLKDILPKFVRAYPDSCIPYGEMIRNIHLFGDDIYYELKNRTAVLGLKENSPYDEWKVLALSILTHEKDWSNDEFFATIEEYSKFAIHHNRDIFHSVERLSIAIYESKNEIKRASKLVNAMIKKFSDQSELWIFAFEFYKRHGFDYRETSRLFETGVSHAQEMDWPERVIQEQLIFESVHGTCASYQKALLKADDCMTAIMKSRMELEVDEPDTLNGSPQNKRKMEDVSDEPASKKQKHQEPHRNREELTVKVTHIDSSTTEDALKAVFEDCGVINDILIYSDKGSFEAIIEFATMQGVLAALTKSHKRIGNNQITVQRLFNCIIWVTNFPPSHQESDIKQLFSQVGTVVNVRFPHQSSTKARRFCYVEFSDAAAETAVTQFNGHKIRDELDGKQYELVVKVSENQKKASPVFKREVYISNIDFSVEAEEIRHFFESCGGIETVTLPIKPEMREKGNKNGGFGFVVFKSETSVAPALKKNGSKLKGRPINVSTSKKTGNKVNLADFDETKSVVIFNIPANTVAEQLELFLKESLDVPMEKVKVLPESEAAIVQFESVADGGKASLKLGSMQFKERDLRIGTKRELKPAAVTMVPTSVRRRRK